MVRGRENAPRRTWRLIRARRLNRRVVERNRSPRGQTARPIAAPRATRLSPRGRLPLAMRPGRVGRYAQAGDVRRRGVLHRRFPRFRKATRPLVESGARLERGATFSQADCGGRALSLPTFQRL